jgi:intracellular septation protein A
MNKWRLIVGIACLVVAGILAIMILVVPGKVMYYVGDQNYPWLPTIVFGIVGFILLASARVRKKPAP